MAESFATFEDESGGAARETMPKSFDGRISSVSALPEPEPSSESEDDGYGHARASGYLMGGGGGRDEEYGSSEDEYEEFSPPGRCSEYIMAILPCWRNPRLRQNYRAVVAAALFMIAGLSTSKTEKKKKTKQK